MTDASVQRFSFVLESLGVKLSPTLQHSSPRTAIREAEALASVHGSSIIIEDARAKTGACRLFRVTHIHSFANMCEEVEFNIRGTTGEPNGA